MVIDAHAHVFKPLVKNDIEVLEDSRKNGVEAVVNSADSPKEYTRLLKQHEMFPDFLFVTFGFGPSRFYEYDLERAKKLIIEHKKDLVAIGEIDLDHYWVKDSTLQKRQREVFIELIKFSNELNLPLVIHSRKAEDEVVNVLSQFAEVPVLLHSFDGKPPAIKKALDLDYYISIPTAVVLRKNYKRVALHTPLENMTIETDAPFLSPIPKERNQPKYVIYAAKKIAEIKELELSEVIIQTTKNARLFYKI